jgi:NAD(P)-dependent dehydrogenase (short-subunit alcohol dehydrogenase family)
MELGLEGRVAVVTGAGAGIGLATARLLVAEGARVVVVDLDPSAATQIAPQEMLVPLVRDLASPQGGPDAVATAVERFGAIDILVNNVGVAPHRDGFLTVSDKDWLSLIELNFLSMVRCCRAAIPHMVEQGRGSIISLSSDTGYAPAPYFVDYAMTKAMVRVLSKTLATEFAAHGIRSNTISPGPTRTTPWEEQGGFMDSYAARFGIDHEAAIERFMREERNIGSGRIGEADDVAAMIVFLASDRAVQITGSDYRVDGGQLATI